MQKQIARASRFRCPKLAAERRARRRAGQRKRSILANAPFLDRFKSKLEALAASCRLCTNFEFPIKKQPHWTDFLFPLPIRLNCCAF